MKFKYPGIFCLLIIAFSCQNGPSNDNKEFVNSFPEIQQLTELIQGHPNDASLYFDRAKMYDFHENFSAARQDLHQAIQLDSSLVDAWHLWADIEIDNYNSFDALKIMESASERFPENINTMLKLSEFQLILKQYNEALKTLQLVFQQSPTNAEAYFMRGMVFKELKDTSNAIINMKLATREDPEIIDAWLILGELTLAQGDPHAIDYFTAILEVDPNNEPARFGIGQYWLEQNNFDQALSTYQELQKLNQFDPNIYFNLGIVYLEVDSLQHAREHFELSIKSDPSFAIAYLYRGFSNELMGYIDEAITDYQNTLKIEPDNVRAKEGLRRLRK